MRLHADNASARSAITHRTSNGAVSNPLSHARVRHDVINQVALGAPAERAHGLGDEASIMSAQGGSAEIHGVSRMLAVASEC